MRRIAVYHLETLLCIARHGTFAAAAARLNTTQPAISARVRELESQLGFDIFQREGRRMALTVRGRRLVRDCEPLWTSIERALLPARGSGEPSGLVRIGAGEIAAASCLPGFVAGIERDMPGVTLDIEIDLTAHLQQKLLAGATDIVFLGGPIVAPGLRSSPIGGVQLLWLASAVTAARMRGGDEAAPPIWSLPHHSPLYRAMREVLAEGTIDYRSVNTCGNVRMLIDIVTAGIGIAIFPETMVRPLIAQGALVEIWPRPARTIIFEAAIREEEREPAVLDIFERAATLSIEQPPAAWIPLQNGA